MVTAVMTTMEGDLHAVDFKLQRELRDLVDYLNRTKAELAALRGGGAEGTIPTATDELDAVIATTQDAAGQILDCAEQLQDFAATLPEEQGSLILGLATRIFEAS
ncbi:MAG: chemotaxis protein CheZ, partial [Alphaproteobacteria bacterium]|nr:chemotaxis protein CheZ [Alphaproteobacteria bacterium]